VLAKAAIRAAREALGDRLGLAEKQMFGGLAFLVYGNMACGVRADDLIVRVAADDAEEEDLRRWVDRGLACASSLPPR
jgi:TfoX/Sxy family transcriptional regulator of competence genes